MAVRSGCSGGVGVVRVAGDRRREVEAEPVDLHLLRPVAQGVEHEARTGIRRRVHGVAATGRVDVRAVRVLAVVVRVVETAQAGAGPADALLGGVVVDDVEDDFEPRFVEQTDHPLELREDRFGSLLACILRGVGGVRGEEVQRVVAPVVREPALEQARLRDERVHGEEFDRGDPERVEVLDHRRMGEPGVGAVEGGRHIGLSLGEALEVALVDDRAVERDTRLSGFPPVETVDDHDRPPFLVPVTLGEAAGVGIEEQRLGVERIARSVRATDADRVPGSGLEERCRDLPHPARKALEGDLVGRPVEIGRVEHHEFDGGRILRPDAQRADPVVQTHAEIVEGGAAGRGEDSGLGHEYTLECCARVSDQ